MHIMSLPDERIRIAYLELPGENQDAAPLVFLHGLGGSSITAFPEIAARAELRAHRSILIDLPGFGYSTALDSWSYSIEAQAEVIGNILDRLNLPPVHLVGHSMGGSIAITLAHSRPDLIAGLIVAEPNLDPGTGSFSGQIARMSESAFVNRGRDFILRAIDIEASSGESTAAALGRTVRQASPLALHRAATSLQAGRSPTFREKFLGLRLPRVYIAGELSNDVPPGDLIPYDIEFIEIPNAGHIMMDDNPDAFASAIASGIR